MISHGLLPWYTDDHARISFFRPLSSLSHSLDYFLWPNQPALMHAHSLLWLAALVVLVSVLFRRMLGPTWVAGAASLMYAVDDAHSFPAAWLANRNALIAGVFGVASLLAHDRWRRDGWRVGALLGPLCLAIALCAGESALAICAYVFAYAVCIDAAPKRMRALSLAGYAFVAIVWQLAYRVAGFGSHNSGLYVDPGGDPVRFLGAVLERGPVLMLGQLTPVPIDFHALSPRAVQLAMTLGGCAATFVLFWFSWPRLRRDPTTRFFALGMLLAVVPVCATFPMARVLVFVGIGAMGLLAQLLEQWLAPDREIERSRPRRALALVGWLVAITNLMIAPVMLSVTSLLPLLIGKIQQKAMDSIAADPEVTGRNVIVISSPDVYSTIFVPYVRAVAGTPAPKSLLRLAASHVDLDLTRIDDRTLVVRARGGSLAEKEGLMLRSRERPQKAGDRISVQAGQIEVLDVDALGLPTSISLHLEYPLDHPRYLWAQWGDWRFVPFAPPSVGATLTIARARVAPF